MSANGSPAEMSRRRFLSNIVKAVGTVISIVVAAPLVGYFLSPAWTRPRSLSVAIANVSDIPVGQPTFVTYEQRVRDGWYVSTLSKGAWVVTKDGKEFTVFDPRCTHLSCPYYWDKNRGIFQCPCHDGRFDIDGNVIHGPPPRPLDRLESTVQEDVIVVTGNIIGRA